MTQTRFEMKKENGRYLTFDELYDLAKDEIEEVLNNMYDNEALTLGNAIRENNRYDTLYENTEDNVNQMLNNEAPWDILNSDWDSGYEYFTYDYAFKMTDDVWYDLDTEEIAEAILDGGYSRYLNSDLKDILDDYEEAKDWLENFNPLREAGAVVLAKYVNCEADVNDLLRFINDLVRNDEAWDDLA